MYTPQAIRNWNGNFYQGTEAITKHFYTLTPGNFNIETYDSQPIGGVTSL